MRKRRVGLVHGMSGLWGERLFFVLQNRLHGGLLASPGEPSGVLFSVRAGQNGLQPKSVSKLDGRPCPLAMEGAMHITTMALVLRTVDYKETDKILTLLTRDQGKLTASARGCRKKGSAIAAGCQLLAWSEVVLYDYQGRWSVKEAAVERLFQGVRDDIERLALGCYFAEVTELLAVEGEENPELLSLILNSLHALDKLPEKPLPLVKAAFEWKAMALAGYEPLIDGCAVCGAHPSENPRFHLREGVLHCAKCRGEVGEGISMPLSLPALAALEHIVHGDPKRLFSFRLDGEPLKELADAAEAYLHTQLERGFSTLDYYKSLQLS